MRAKPSLRLRDGPGERDAIIGRLRDGTSVRILCDPPQLVRSSRWVRVTTAEGTGWVAAEHAGQRYLIRP